MSGLSPTIKKKTAVVSVQVFNHWRRTPGFISRQLLDRLHTGIDS